MFILQLTEGSGERYSGVGIRDQALCNSLRRIGHKVTIVPLGDRLTIEEEEAWPPHIFYERGIVSMEQTSALFRNLPDSLRNLVGNTKSQSRSIDQLAESSSNHRADFLLSLLRGPDGNQARQHERLIRWIESQKPDVVSISSVRHMGVVPAIVTELGIPVVVSFVNHMRMLEDLPETHREEAWRLLTEALKHASAIVVPSEYYADFLRKHVEVSPERVHVIMNGLALNYYSIRPALPPHPVIGYLGHLEPESGLEEVIEAYQQLKKDEFPTLKLHLAGSIAEEDLDYLSKVMSPVTSRSEEPEVQMKANPTLIDKVGFLQNLTALSVPGRWDALGTYAIEAMAVGVPVVLPDWKAYPELIEKTGGGLLYTENDFNDYCEVLKEVLNNREHNERLGNAAREAILEHFSSEQMAGKFIDLFTNALGEAKRDLKAGVPDHP